MALREILRYIALFVTIVIHCTGSLNAQWKSVGGPSGGKLDVLAYFEEKVYCANRLGTGYFVADHKSVQWSASESLQNYNIISFESDNLNLYAVTAQGAVLKKEPGIEKWNKAFFSIQNEKITGLSINNGIIAIALKETVRVTDDNGKTWMSYTVKDSTITCLKIIRDQIWFGTATSGLYRIEENAIQPIGLRGSYIKDIVSHKNDIFIATIKGISFLKSGQPTLIAANDGLLTKYVLCLATNDSSLIAGTYTGGTYLWKENARTWEPIDTLSLRTSGAITVNALAFAKNSLFRSLNAEGIFSTADLGKNWKYHNNGLMTEDVTSISKLGNFLLTGVEGKGIYVSRDEGGTFALNTLPGTKQHSFYLAHSQKTFFCSTLEGVFTYKDNTTWENKATIIGNASVSFIKEDGNTIYACTQEGVFRTFNDGITWLSMRNPSDESTCLSARNGEVIVGSTSGGIFLYKNFSNSWQAISVGLPKNRLPLTNYRRVRSVLNSTIGKFAGIDGEGLYAKYDERDWAFFPIGKNVDTVFDLIEVDSNLLAATNKGVFVYNTKVGIWRQVTSQFSNAAQALSLYSDSTSLYAGFRGKSLYKIPLKEVLMPRATIVSDSIFCLGDSVKLRALGFGPFKWEIGNLLYENRETLSLKLTEGVKVKVIGKGEGFDTISLIPKPIKVCHPINFLSDTTACPGDSLLIRVLATGKVNWFTAENNMVFSGLTYKTVFKDNTTFIAEGEFGERDTLNVRKKEPNICFPVSIFGDSVFCPSKPISLKASGDVSYWWAWSSEPNDTVSKDSIFTLSIDQPKQLILTGGRGGQKSINLRSKEIADCFPLIIYEVITPNNDGKNDYFFIENIAYYQNKVSVYNKWGSEVFSKESYDNTWKGDNLPPDLYYYIIETNQGKFKGSLLLKR